LLSSRISKTNHTQINESTYFCAIPNGSSINAIGQQVAFYATGNYINAFGYFAASSATGNDIIAIGNYAAYRANGNSIVALGINAADTTVGNDITAIGNQAAFYATGNNIIAIGQNTQYNYATGSGITASNVIAIGDNAIASSDYALALGSSATAAGYASVAIGYQAFVLDANSIAIGLNAFAGTWGIGARIRDMSFLTDLRHTLRVNFFGGTNSPQMAKYILGKKTAGARGGFIDDFNSTGGLYLTTQDYGLELNLDSSYKIYENLEMIVSLGYIHLWLDQSRAVWGADPHRGLAGAGNGAHTRGVSVTDALKAALYFQYSF